MNIMEDMAVNNGEITVKGKRYIFTGPVYIDCMHSEYPFFQVNAISPEDNENETGYRPAYNIRWNVLEEFVNRTDNVYTINTDVENDTLCDWKKPDEINCNAEYNVTTGCFY